MAFYDLFSRFYDAALEPLYAPHRVLAAEALALAPGMSVLDLPCGTGQSFAALARGLGERGTIVGLDASAGMLSKAAERAASLNGPRIVTAIADVSTLDPETLRALAFGSGQVDCLHVFLGMSVFSDMHAAFDRLWRVLAPGGRAVLVDVHSARLGVQGYLVNRLAGADIRRRFWEPLRAHATDFELRDLPFRSQHGGQIMLAAGNKP